MTVGFAEVSIKGEGIMSVMCLVSPSPLIPLPSRERGILSVGLDLFTRVTLPHLWVAECLAAKASSGE